MLNSHNNPSAHSRVTTLRRLLILTLFALWQGGFMFYGAVVVPVGARVLESETEQGFITQQVTWWLNVIGLVTLIVWGISLILEPTAKQTAKTVIALWFGLVGSVIVLMVLHGRMSGLLDLEGHSVIDPDRFYMNHRLYLIVSTLQWLGSLLLLQMTIQGWFSDRRFETATSHE